MNQEHDFSTTSISSNGKSTRHSKLSHSDLDFEGPRLGRRESEPHSQEIMYLYDVLSTNFPESRTLWDLHHYFAVNGTEFDIQFDISFIQKIGRAHV